MSCVRPRISPGLVQGAAACAPHHHARAEFAGDDLAAVTTAGFALEVSFNDRLLVLHHGQLLATGTPAQIRADPDVLTAYLGTTHVG